jgi:hypothetical protein
MALHTHTCFVRNVITQSKILIEPQNRIKQIKNRTVS